MCTFGHLDIDGCTHVCTTVFVIIIVDIWMFTYSQTPKDIQTDRPSLREVQELERRGSREEERRGGKRRGKERGDREMEVRKEGTKKDQEKKSESRREF